MSVDWDRYSTPVESQNRSRTPSDNGVVTFVALKLRQLPGQILEHSPIRENRSHSEVIGEKTEEVRLKMMECFEWEIGI
ncbi:MAG: hypothetical protein IMZ61_15310 [Planctomycetes bacterium]|nr:hypothetical protein [Planctomycetota bacterium]